MEEYEVTHRPERNRFELEKNGMTAFVEYEVEDGHYAYHRSSPSGRKGDCGSSGRSNLQICCRTRSETESDMFVCCSLAEAASGGINGTSSDTAGDVSNAFSPEDYTDCHRLEY